MSADPAAYPLPAAMRRADGSARFAYVTLLMLNDAYLPGVLVLARGLRNQATQADLVCLITPEVSESARAALRQLYDRVIEVEAIYTPHKRRQERQYIPYVFTRLHMLRLGEGGGLSCRYEKIVALDADVLPLAAYDHLFTLPAPAGVLNERKAHFLEYDAEGKYILPPSVATDGTWRWHAEYNPLCPHGEPIPKAVTDRVREDPTNMGVNSALLVLAPSLHDYTAMRADLERPETLRAVGDLYEWPDMQYFTAYWSGRWTNVDIRFCGFSGYPSLALLFGSHYAGIKPWAFQKAGAMARYARFEDFQLWFAEYLGMLAAYPALRKVPRLERLRESILALKRGAPSGSRV